MSDLFGGSEGSGRLFTLRSRVHRAALAFAACLLTTGAYATVVTDSANDFVPSFLGVHSGDLDVLSTFATFNGTIFEIGATVNAPVGTLPSALYVFGFNRGIGSSNFAAIGHAGVVFDAVITMTGTGVTGGRDLIANTAIALPAGAAHISGSTFFIDVPAALLPTEGFLPSQYGVNLWPRDAAVAPGTGQISDFAPDNAVFTVSPAATVPEPQTNTLFIAGLGALVALSRRRRQQG